MRPTLTLIFPIALVLVLIACGGEEATPTPAPASPPPPPAAPAPQTTSGGDSEPTQAAPAAQPSEGTQFSLINGDPGGPTKAYKFVPSEMTFNVGETVLFAMSSESELHNFSIDALEIDEDVSGGEQATFSFTFQEAGTYRFYCLFHDANGMEGTVTVQ